MSFKSDLLPFKLSPGICFSTVAEFVDLIVRESDAQVKEKLRDKPDIEMEEFRMGCDALNYWRIYLRLLELVDYDKDDPRLMAISSELRALISKRRKYELDDFVSAMESTRERVRMPWGFSSLRLAYSFAEKRPIQLNQAELKDAKLPTLIASISYYLDRMDKMGGVILLPVNSIRSMVNQRKLVVGGAIKRLVQAGILEIANSKYYTGTAREFRFSGKRDVHYTINEMSDTDK